MADVIRSKKRRERNKVETLSVLSSSMADVPLDILINNVFIRLPVRSLLRCTGVCKQWLQLLTESELKRILLFKHQKTHNQKILCGPILYNKVHACHNEVFRCPDEPELDYYVKFGAFHGVFYSIDLSSASARQVPGFPLHPYIVTRTLGYCNGMVCMEAWNWEEEDYAKRKNLLFGNPSTGDYKMMLHDPVNVIDPPLLIGFGYDSSVDDYKFVRVDNITRNSHIFSLKLNSWTTILGSSDNYWIKPTENFVVGIDDNLGSFVAGSIYWLLETTDNIVWFDLKDEEFRELLLPRPNINMLGEKSLKVVGGGSLCMINLCRNNNEVVMWSMLKEEENNKQEHYWIKWMTVSFSGTNFWGCYNIYPLSFVKDGKVLCCVEHGREKYAYRWKLNYVLIDPKTNRLEDFTLPGISSIFLKDYTFELQHSGYIDSLINSGYY